MRLGLVLGLGFRCRVWGLRLGLGVRFEVRPGVFMAGDLWGLCTDGYSSCFLLQLSSEHPWNPCHRRRHCNSGCR